MSLDPAEDLSQLLIVIMLHIYQQTIGSTDLGRYINGGITPATENKVLYGIEKGF